MVEMYMCRSEDMEKASVHRYHSWMEMFVSDPELEGKVHCTDILVEENGNFYKIIHWFYLENGMPIPLSYTKELITQC